MYELVKTDFKLRYQGSFLGILWSVLKPLMLFGVMYMVFVRFLKISDGTPTYPLVILLGISLWSFFTESTTLGMRSIVDRGDILRKINFPKYIIILSSMMTALISLSINLCVVVIFAILSGVKFGFEVFLVPLSIIQLFFIAFGVASILATLYVKFRDIGHIYEVILQVLFYATPIIYPVAYLAKAEIFQIPVQNIVLFSPVAQAIQDVRHNLIAPLTTTTSWDIFGVWTLCGPILITILLVVVGVWYFNNSSKKFAEMI